MIITPEDLAEMLGISRKTVIDRYSKQPGFPAPVTSPKKPRWLESEVMKFLRRKSAENGQAK